MVGPHHHRSRSRDPGGPYLHLPPIGPWTRRAAFLQLPIGACQFLPCVLMTAGPLVFLPSVLLLIPVGIALLPFLLQGPLRRGNGGAVSALLLTSVLVTVVAARCALDPQAPELLRRMMAIYLPIGSMGALSLLMAEIEIFRAGRT